MEVQYIDWNNSIQILNKAYDAGLFVLIIGPKGTGKTSLVRDFAKNRNLDLESINFSLRTRESHLIGTKTLTEGTVRFDEGLLIKSIIHFLDPYPVRSGAEPSPSESMS